jgi:hypothetical protein
MGAVFPVATELAYAKRLIGAGWEGFASARGERETRTLPGVSWTPAAIGAAVGVLSARAFGNRRSASTVALGAVIGSMVGCGAAVAWKSRGLVLPAALGALREVNAIRDARWLETNPIDYA